MAVMKDPKDRKLSIPPKPADVLLKSTPSSVTHLLSPTYSTDADSLNNQAYTGLSKYMSVLLREKSFFRPTNVQKSIV